MAPRAADTMEELPLPKVAPEWADFYKNFMAAAEGRAEQTVKLAESRRVMQVIEAAFESERIGKSVLEKI